MSNRADLIEQWLDTKPSTLWADWDIEDDEQRRMAAEWLDRQLDQFEGWSEDQVLRYEPGYGFFWGVDKVTVS